MSEYEIYASDDDLAYEGPVNVNCLLNVNNFLAQHIGKDVMVYVFVKKEATIEQIHARMGMNGGDSKCD